MYNVDFVMAQNTAKLLFYKTRAKAKSNKI